MQHPWADTAWMEKEAEDWWVLKAPLEAAPYYDGSYLIFYDGNLQNYFHWLAEGLLLLDALTQAVGSNPNFRIVLPKSMDLHAAFEHRASLPALGFDGIPVVEVGEDLIRVKEAIWIDSSDFIEYVPASYVRNFQRRIAAKYANVRGPRNRRLLIVREGWSRQIHNLDALQVFLGELGFETVCLEGMSIENQILLFQEAEFVVAAHGAGLTNLLYCEPGTKVIEFMPVSEMRPFFWTISEKLDLVHAMQFCAPGEGEGFQASLDVDLDKFQALYRMVEAHR